MIFGVCSWDERIWHHTLLLCFFPEELKTYPGLSHLYGGGIEILTIGNGEALNNTQITTKN